MSCFSLIIFNNSDWYLGKRITMHFLKFLFVLGLPIQFYHLPKLSVFQPSGWLWFLSILCHLVLALQGSALFLENFCIKSPGSLYGTLCGSLNITKLKLVYHFSIISQTALFCSSEFSAYVSHGRIFCLFTFQNSNQGSLCNSASMCCKVLY